MDNISLFDAITCHHEPDILEPNPNSHNLQVFQKINRTKLYAKEKNKQSMLQLRE